MSKMWHYAQDGQIQNPIPEEELFERLVKGELDPEDMVWCQGMPDWLPAWQVDELAPAVARAVSQTPTVKLSQEELLPRPPADLGDMPTVIHRFEEPPVPASTEPTQRFSSEDLASLRSQPTDETPSEAFSLLPEAVESPGEPTQRLSVQDIDSALVPAPNLAAPPPLSTFEVDPSAPTQRLSVQDVAQALSPTEQTPAESAFSLLPEEMEAHKRPTESLSVQMVASALAESTVPSSQEAKTPTQMLSAQERISALLGPSNAPNPEPILPPTQAIVLPTPEQAQLPTQMLSSQERAAAAPLKPTPTPEPAASAQPAPTQAIPKKTASSNYSARAQLTQELMSVMPPALDQEVHTAVPMGSPVPTPKMKPGSRSPRNPETRDLPAPPQVWMRPKPRSSKIWVLPVIAALLILLAVLGVGSYFLVAEKGLNSLFPKWMPPSVTQPALNPVPAPLSGPVHEPKKEILKQPEVPPTATKPDPVPAMIPPRTGPRPMRLVQARPRLPRPASIQAPSVAKVQEQVPIADPKPPEPTGNVPVIPADLPVQVLSMASPVYPSKALGHPDAEMLRTVQVRVFVLASGEPLLVKVVQGGEDTWGFHEAAKAAALKCKYQPATQKGRPISEWIRFSLTFDRPKL